MSAGIQKLFDDAVQEKILDAHLRAQTAQQNVQNAAKATQAALDKSKPTSETDMEAFIQNAINAGIEKAIKNFNSPTTPKSPKATQKALPWSQKATKTNAKKEKTKRNKRRNQPTNGNAPTLKGRTTTTTPRARTSRNRTNSAPTKRDAAAANEEKAKTVKAMPKPTTNKTM